MQTSTQQHPGTTSSAPATASSSLLELVDLYMKAYAGRDRTRIYQLAWLT